MRHVSAARGIVFITTTSGQLFALNAHNGRILFHDQSPDLNEVFDLGLGKPHHASMNSGTVIADGMVFVGYGAQNNPSGGLFAYEINHRPAASNDVVSVSGNDTVVIDALANDFDPDGDSLQFVRIAGRRVDTEDGQPDTIHVRFGTFVVVNPGDDPDDADAAYLTFTPSWWFHGSRRVRYAIADMAPNRIVNGVELDEPNPTHKPRTGSAWMRLHWTYGLTHSLRGLAGSRRVLSDEGQTLPPRPSHVQHTRAAATHCIFPAPGKETYEQTA